MENSIVELVHNIKDFVEKHRGYGEAGIVSLYQALISHRIAGKTQREFSAHVQRTLLRALAVNETVAAIDDYTYRHDHRHLSEIQRHAIAQPMALGMNIRKIREDPMKFFGTHVGTVYFTLRDGRPIARLTMNILVDLLETLENNLPDGGHRGGHGSRG
jgi:hypothetical protein